MSRYRYSQQRANQRSGAVGENVAMRALVTAGYRRIKKIHTGFVKIKGQWKPRKKVDGDLRAIEPHTGRAVLAEVKRREDKLLYSDLNPHQRDGLTEHAEFNGIALVVWVHREGVAVMTWPIAGFEPRTSLSIKRAKELSLI